MDDRTKALFAQYGLKPVCLTDGTYWGDISMIHRGLFDMFCFVEMGITHVSGSLNCSNNQIQSLTGCPSVRGDLILSNNKLITLRGLPKVGGSLTCTRNTIIALPENMEVGNWVSCMTNNITDIPMDFKTPLSKLRCDEIVKQGSNYRAMKALESF